MAERTFTEAEGEMAMRLPKVEDIAIRHVSDKPGIDLEAKQVTEAQRNLLDVAKHPDRSLSRTRSALRTDDRQMAN